MVGGEAAICGVFLRCAFMRCGGIARPLSLVSGKSSVPQGLLAFMPVALLRFERHLYVEVCKGFRLPESTGVDKAGRKPIKGSPEGCRERSRQHRCMSMQRACRLTDGYPRSDTPAGINRACCHGWRRRRRYGLFGRRPAHYTRRLSRESRRSRHGFPRRFLCRRRYCR